MIVPGRVVRRGGTLTVPCWRRRESTVGVVAVLRWRGVRLRGRTRGQPTPNPSEQGRATHIAITPVRRRWRSAKHAQLIQLRTEGSELRVLLNDAANELGIKPSEGGEGALVQRGRLLRWWVLRVGQSVGVVVLLLLLLGSAQTPRRDLP